MFSNCDFFKFFLENVCLFCLGQLDKSYFGTCQQLRQSIGRNADDSMKVGKNISLFDLILI